jgi:hypothetical protein
MKLFRKKEEFDDQPEDEVPEKINAGIAATVDTVKAKLEAISELRKADSEHFSRISEQIGELRNLMLEKEEEIKELGIKAVKASEMVGELQPEKIMSEIGRSNAKFEQVNAKIEATKQLYEKMLEELKGLRVKLSIFQGTESLMELNKETSQNLYSIKKTEATIERQSNVVGNMFVQFQKQINEFSKEKDKASAVEEKMRQTLKEVDDIRIKAQSAIVNMSDLEEMKKQIEAEIRTQFAAVYKSNMEEIKKQVEQETKAKSTNANRSYLDEMRNQIKLELKEQDSHKEILEMRTRLNEVEQSFKEQNSQKTAAEKLIADGILEIKHINRIQEEEISELRRDFSETKDRVYDKLLPAITSARITPSPGNALKERYFTQQLDKLKHAIARSDVKTAGRIYNELREIYGGMARDSASSGKRKILHARLIKLYESLNRLAKKN